MLRGDGLGIATQGGKLELNDMEIRVAAPDTTALYNYGIRISAYNTAGMGKITIALKLSSTIQK